MGEPVPEKLVLGDALGSDEPFTPERVWFADGGITNNFSFHLFDSPIPRWPIFCLDFDDLRPDLTDHSPRTGMPTSNVGGIAPVWTRLATAASFFGVGPFVFHCSCLPEQARGRLNLNMAADIVKALSGFGQQAAGDRIEHFIDGTEGGQPTPVTWDSHRWIRYRSATAVLQQFLAEYAFSIENRVGRLQHNEPSGEDSERSAPRPKRKATMLLFDSSFEAVESQ